MNTSHHLSGCILSAALLLAGCGAEPAVPRVSVEGTVTLDGKPLAQALVRFVANADGHDAVATVNQGSFSLLNENGPTIGEHHVLVTPIEPELEQAMGSIQSGDRDPLRSRTVPAKYQSPGLLHATVLQDNANRFEFALTTR